MPDFIRAGLHEKILHFGMFWRESGNRYEQSWGDYRKRSVVENVAGMPKEWGTGKLNHS